MCTLNNLLLLLKMKIYNIWGKSLFINIPNVKFTDFKVNLKALCKIFLKQ